MSEATGSTESTSDSTNSNGARAEFRPMKDDLRQAYNDVKKFVKEHPAATVGTVTTLLAWRFGRKSGMKVVGKTVARDLKNTLAAYDEALALSSVWHREGKQVTEAMHDALEFIDMNHMNHEWAQFLSSKGKI